MRIIKGEAWLVSMRLEEPYSVAYGFSDRATNVFLRLETDSGINGFGCVAPDVEVTGETPERTLATLERVVLPLVKGEDALRLTSLLERAAPHLEGEPGALGALDLALFDILGKRAGLPAWRLLGGYREKIETSITLGILSEEATLERALHWVARGFRCLKIKGGLDCDGDIARVRRVREVVGSNVRIRFDANQGYTVEQALSFGRAVEPALVELIEQPTPKGRRDLLAQVSAHSPLPVMADECLLTLRDAMSIAREKGADLFNVKLTKVGGIEVASRIVAVAKAAGIDVMVGCMDEAALGIAAGLSFALARPEISMADLDGHIGLIGDPTDGAVTLKEGYLIPSDKPGFGVAL